MKFTGESTGRKKDGNLGTSQKPGACQLRSPVYGPSVVGMKLEATQCAADEEKVRADSVVSKKTTRAKPWFQKGARFPAIQSAAAMARASCPTKTAPGLFYDAGIWILFKRKGKGEKVWKMLAVMHSPRVTVAVSLSICTGPGHAKTQSLPWP